MISNDQYGPSTLPGPVKSARVVLYLGAFFSALVAVGVLLTGPDGATVGRMVWAVWPGVVAFLVAVHLERGGRWRYTLSLVVAGFWLLGALGTIGRGEARGFGQLILPVLLLVFVLRPESRDFFALASNGAGGGRFRQLLRRPDNGVTAAEYLGVLVVVAVIIAAIAGSGVGSTISSDVGSAVCRIMSGEGCGDGSGGSSTAAGGPGGTGAGDPAGPGAAARADGSGITVRDDETDATDAPPAEKPFCSGFWNCALKQTGSGIANVFQGAWSDVTGLVGLAGDLITDPVSVGKGLWQAVTHPVDTLSELIWSEEVSSRWDRGDYGGAIGRELWNIGSFFIPVGDIAAGVARGAKIAKGAKAADLAADAARVIDRVSDLASDADRAADAAEAAARAGKAADAEAAAIRARKAADDAAAKAREIGCPLAIGPVSVGGVPGRAAMGAGRPMRGALRLIAAGGCDDVTAQAKAADEAADQAEDAAAHTPDAAVVADPAFTKGALGEAFEPGVVDPAGSMTAKERAIADWLEQNEGARVDARVPDHASGQKNPDTMVRTSATDPGTIVEFKTLESGSSTAVRRNLLDAAKQTTDGVVVIDGRAAGLTEDAARQGWARAQGQATQYGQTMPSKATIILADGSSVTLP